MCILFLITHGLFILNIKEIFDKKILLELILWHYITGLGVTAGLHRLWSHKSYKVKAPTEFLLMILSSIANQGSIYHWCRDHRLHHKYSDTNKDPHNIKNGFFYSHIGWLLTYKTNEVKEAGKEINNEDLLKNWIIKLNYNLNPYWNQAWCFIMPGIYGIYKFNSFYKGFIIFGIIRWLLVLHSTWCVNSVAHMYGSKSYKNIEPRESLITSIVAIGEGWHNWHHSYPYDYAAAKNNYYWNPTKYFIDFLWLIGQSYNHKKVKLNINKI
jgi:stearoyl-CoA desaturase (delta-9 desaturase)